MSGRRRISLYIAGSRADLGDDSLVLMNFALTDLTNPAVLRNSWSQDVTLPGTPANDRLFGAAFRVDRTVASFSGGTGADFDPSRKASFAVFDELSGVLMAGYARINSVAVSGGVAAYSVTLFGGLGEFLNGLAADEDGTRRTLADLDYLGGGDGELDFTITADAVEDAWARILGDSSRPDMWDVINFAPAYNGIPDGFDADKAVADPAAVGLPASVTVDGTEYQPRAGLSLFNLAREHDEWAVKDLRSYLQRPVVSMWRVLMAIADPANNGGWTVDLSDVDSTEKFPYRDTWMTLPLLPSIDAGAQDPDMRSGWLTDGAVGTFAGYAWVRGADTGTEVSVRISLNLGYAVQMNGTPPAKLYPWSVIDGWIYAQVLFVQPVAYAADGTKMAAGKVQTIFLTGLSGAVDVTFDPQRIAEVTGYVPDRTNLDEAFAPTTAAQQLLLERTGVLPYYMMPTPVEVDVTGYDIDRVEVSVVAYRVRVTAAGSVGEPSGGFRAGEALWTSLSGGTEVTPSFVYTTGTAVSAYAGEGAGIRSGARITKAMLLSTEHTPADYLVSLCKVFGLSILADGATKTVRILRRSSLFIDETGDLSGRVDVGRDYEVLPLAFDARWYDLSLEGVGGAFEEEYRQMRGRDYGSQRVDTGCEFDADVRKMLEGAVLRSAAAVLDKSRYYNTCRLSGAVVPSVFADAGNTYTLYAPDGSETETEIRRLDALATVTWLNAEHPGYDLQGAAKAEFRDAGNAPVDGSGVLLMMGGSAVYPYFKITDDIPAMDAMNGGTACWLLAPGPAAGVTVPLFSRYLFEGDTVRLSLDFGVPAELDIPGVECPAGSTVYAKAWRAYIADRLSVHGKVLRCRVRLDGLQVGPELLRRFWWWGGSLWVISSISNYSLTTFDPVEVELVQVRDKDNYLTDFYNE